MRKANLPAAVTLILLFIIVAVVWSSCSERLVDDSDKVNLKIPLGAGLLAAKSLAAADLYRLTVTDNAGDSVLIQTQLVRSGSLLVGSVEDLPAGKPLTFLIEAEESETGTIIYTGSAVAIVVADETITLDIPLSPVVPLLRFVPSYVQLLDDSTFVLDTRIYNLDSLFGISFRMWWPAGFPLRIDSAQPGGDVNSPSIIFFAQPGTGPHHTFSITQTGAGEAIVDSTGAAHLARIFCTVEDFFSVMSSRVDITLEPTGLTGVDSTTIPLGILYTDDCALEVGASAGPQ